MSLQEKYSKALEVGQKVGIQDGYVKEENGQLIVGGTAKHQLDKDRVWNAIKEAGGEQPKDIRAEIQVADGSIYGVYEVLSGDTLSMIAKHVYGNAGDYMRIFEANRDQLSDPNLIRVGQKLVIPNA